jgi:hypothetical protein
VQLRHDRIRVGLFDTAGACQIIATTRDDKVRETSSACTARAASS